MEHTQTEVKDIQQMFDRDSYLRPYEKEIRRRFVFLTSNLHTAYSFQTLFVANFNFSIFSKSLQGQSLQ